MSRLVDQGAIYAGWVGVGMAATIVISFELVIPLQSVVFIMALLGGLLIGYYANARADRRTGPWSRILVNAVYAGLVTGISLALLYGGVRLLFMYADDGYRIPSEGGRLTCSAGPDCTYQRYLADPQQAPKLKAEGITDAATFQTSFLRQQLQGGLALLVITTGTAALGGVFYGASRPKPDSSAPAATPTG